MQEFSGFVLIAAEITSFTFSTATKKLSIMKHVPVILDGQH